MRHLPLILGATALIVLAGCKSEEDEAREALADALQHYAVMQDEGAATSERIAAGQTLAVALDSIVTDYATTDLGLEIASGGKVGEFTVAELDQRIADLEKLRAFEICDEAPTPDCVVDRFVAARGLDSRADLFEAVIPDSGVMMALATRDAAAAAQSLRASTDPSLNAMALALAPAGALDKTALDSGFDGMGDGDIEIASVIAAYRIASGETDTSLGDVAKAGSAGKMFLDAFANDASLSDQMNALSDMGDGPDWDTLDAASQILGAFRTLPSDDILTSFMRLGHSEEDVTSALMSTWDFDLTDLEESLPPQSLAAYVPKVLADAEASPRDLSLALMLAAVHQDPAQLSEIVADLEQREVMTWDNVRIFPPMVALGYIGDRELFDRVQALLVPPEVHEHLSRAWDSGRALAEGKVSDAALEDGRLFRATVTAASARASLEEIKGFLSDAAGKVQPDDGEFNQTLHRGDVVAAARACKIPSVIAAMDAGPEDFRDIAGACDTTRLGTDADDLPEEDFAIYVENADMFFYDWSHILRTTVETAPERAYAFVQAVSEPEREEFLTGVLALMLAQQDGSASH